MQDTSEDDADNALEQACKNVCDWVEENEAAIKITVGTAVIAATGAATVATGGATAKNFLGATIGGVAGGLLHMLFADEDEKTEGFADGYLLGTAAGATSPSIASLVSSLKNASPLLSNPAVLASIEGFLETAVEEFVLILEGKDVSLASVGVDFLINCFTSGYNPQMDKLGKGMEKVAKKLGKWFEDTVEKGKKLIDDLTGNNGSSKKKTPEVKKETENQSSKLVLPYNLQFFANKGGSSSSKPNQVHHYVTNKSKTYTPQLEEIANKYGLDLDDVWNKDLLPHQGRHPNTYHEYILDSMKQFDEIAQGDKDIFLKLFDNLKNNVKSNPDMLYKDYWE